MSSSPTKSRAQQMLQSQIRQRINYFSPSKNDLDFYQRKVTRLETDLTQLQQQLSAARLRLRTAQDFQIKYALLLKQNSTLLHENGKLTKDLAKRKAEVEQLNGDIHSFGLVKGDLEHTLVKREQEIKELQNRYETLQMTMVQLRQTNQSTNSTQAQLQSLRSTHQQTISTHTQQLAALNKTNNNLTSEVSRLTAKLTQLQQQLNTNASRNDEFLDRVKKQYELKLKDKHEQMEKLKESHQQLSGVNLEELRVRVEEKDEVFAREVEVMRDLLAAKSREVDELLLEKRKVVAGYEQELEELRAQVAALERITHQKQIENQLELQNFKQRLTKLHSQDIQSRNKQHQSQLQSLQKDLANLQQITSCHQQQLSQIRAKHQKQISEHRTHQQHLKHGIQQLKDRIHQHNRQADSQHQILTSINLNLEQQKKASTSDYSNNVTFLDQQLKKSTVVIEQKNLEIGNLLRRLEEVRVEAEAEVNEVREKADKEKRELEEGLEQERKDRRAKEEELKKKEKDIRNREREIQDILAKTQAESKAMQRALDEAHNDYKRLAENHSMLEKLVREQRAKHIGTTGDLNNLRRDKLAELDRQKADLQAVFRQQMDQIKNAGALQIDKLRVQRDRLKAELQQLKLQYTQLEQNFKKVSTLVANQAKVNKDKLAEYQKKMATLNMEINLAQNLYTSFLDAKSRVNKADKENI